MDRGALELTARVVALEFLVETAYAAALMQTRDPVGEARALGTMCAELARRVEAGGADPAIARHLVAAVAHALDAIFGRIRTRLETHARNFPTSGTA